MERFVENFKELDPRVKIGVAAGLCLVIFVNGWRWWANRTPSAAELTERALSADSAAERALSAYQLGDRTYESVPYLRQVWHESGDPVVRGAALEGLARSWDIESIDIMIDAVEHPDPRISARARRATGRVMGFQMAPMDGKVSPETSKTLNEFLKRQWEFDEQTGLLDTAKEQKRKRGWKGK